MSLISKSARLLANHRPERRTLCSNSQITGEQTTPEAIPLNIYEHRNFSF
jgi:hypothetical protein